MAVVQPSAVRKNVAASIDALSGWTESPFMLDSFGNDTDQLQHHAFAVGLTSTDRHPNANRRTPGALLAESTIELRFAHRLPVDGQVAAMDALLDAEHAAIQAALAGASGFHLLWERSRRASPGQGWLISTTTFTAIHQI